MLMTSWKKVEYMLFSLHYAREGRTNVQCVQWSHAHSLIHQGSTCRSMAQFSLPTCFLYRYSWGGHKQNCPSGVLGSVGHDSDLASEGIWSHATKIEMAAKRNQATCMVVASQMGTNTLPCWATRARHANPKQICYYAIYNNAGKPWQPHFLSYFLLPQKNAIMGPIPVKLLVQIWPDL